jgi:hypothetical protein
MRRTVTALAAVLTFALAAPAAADHVSGTVPETIAHPNITQALNNGFYLMVKKGSGGGPSYWNAPYLYVTPYTSDTGWLPGDRVAYACAYAFLQHNGQLVGRVTFQRLSGSASYVFINDKFMNESERYWDGSPTPDPNGTGYSDCPPPGADYTTEVVPDERPKVVYWEGATAASPAEALEIRDYLGIVPGVAGTTFDLIEVIHEPFQVTAPTTGVQTVNSRVTVLAREFGVPVAVVYYDGIGTGQVSEAGT